MAQDPAADIAALIHVLCVIELLHERMEAVSCFFGAVIIMGRSRREAKSRNRWRDDMESWNGRVRRIREQVDDLRDLEERAWPTMHEQQRDRIGSFRSMVHEVKRNVVSVVRVWRLDGCGELLQLGVDRGLFGKPVVVVEPVVAERGEVCQSWAFGVVWFVASRRHWLASIGDALANIVDEARFDVDGEGCWRASVGGANIG